MAATAKLVPRHIAIIMDGNGRWARNRGLPRIKGHEKGAEAVRACVEACGELKVEFLTLYAFSAENWQRPKTEVFALMRLLERFLKEKTPELLEKMFGFRPSAVSPICRRVARNNCTIRSNAPPETPASR